MEEYIGKLQEAPVPIKQHLDNLAYSLLTNKLDEAKRSIDLLFVSNLKDKDYVELLKLIDSLLIRVTNLKHEALD